MPPRRRRTKTTSRSLKSPSKLLHVLKKVQQKKRLTKTDKKLLLRAYKSGKLNKLRGSGIFDSIGSILSKVVTGLGNTLGSIVPI